MRQGKAGSARAYLEDVSFFAHPDLRAHAADAAPLEERFDGQVVVAQVRQAVPVVAQVLVVDQLRLEQELQASDRASVPVIVNEGG